MQYDVQTVDFETKSVLDVRNVGAWRYAEHPSTEILCLSYGLNDGPSKLWRPGQPFPDELIRCIDDGVMFEAHHVQFERAIWIHILLKRLGIPMPRRWQDTLAACAYRGLPLGLDEVGRVLRLTQQKDKRGKYLLQQLSKPRKPLKAERKILTDIGLPEEEWPILWREDEDLHEELGDYCLQDRTTEVELSDRVGPLPVPEQRIWVMDQIINQTGVYIDLDLVNAGLEVARQVEEELTAELVQLTEGAVPTANSRDKFLDWIAKAGYPLGGLTKDDVERALEDDWCEGKPRRALEIRQALAKASTKKLLKFRDTVCADGRVRGLLQYHGAATGRWAGRLVQPQNFPRGSMEPPKGMDMDEWLERVCDEIKLRDADYLRAMYGDPMSVLASFLRPVICAAPGYLLRAADFASIEGRVTAWVAGEQWKLDAFAAADRGEGEEIYCATASPIVGFQVSKKLAKSGDKKHGEARQIGKICELAFGYQGGIGAWRSFDKNSDRTDEEIAGYRDAWRNSHPMTRSAWYGLEEAALNTVKTGKPHRFRMITYEMVEDKAGRWLTCILPNGRRLWYNSPSVERVEKFGRMQDQVMFWGRDSKKNGRWSAMFLYGGLLMENVVQAISRDIMVESMIRVQKVGYNIVMTVHDEIICECHPEFGSQQEFEDLMATNPAWLGGDFPLSVGGWAGKRYRKD